MTTKTKLKLLPATEYSGVNDYDPIRYYYYPVFGKMYRRRVEMCLDECTGGEKALEIGFGTGLSFLNLAEKYQEIHGIDLTVNVNEVEEVFEKHNIKTFLKNGDVLDMPYEAETFDTVLLISILEHLKPKKQRKAFSEIHRVLKPGGQVVYGVPIERPFMVTMFKLLGHDIRQEHFSTEQDVSKAAEELFRKKRVLQMKSTPPLFGAVYEVGHFIKE